MPGGGKGKKAVGICVDESREALERAAKAEAKRRAIKKTNSREKQALVDMAKRDKRNGISEADMKAYRELNDQLPDPFPKGKVRGPESHPNRQSISSQRPHGHVGSINHIPILRK